MKTAVITDSNSGITQAQAKELGISVVPMPVLINGEEFYEDISISQDEFYDKLRQNANVSTSQPNPVNVANYWYEALKTADCVVHIPMSSGLSETCNTLTHFAESDEYFKGKVFVANNQRISVTQRQSVLDAINMAKEGKSAKEICDFLHDTKYQSSIYIMVDTLKYLKKGGRLTPAAAMLGTLLHIKPVLQIQGGKLDKYKQVRKLTAAKTEIIDAICHDLQTRFKDLRERGKMVLAVAHTQNLDEALKFKSELKVAFPDLEVVAVDALSLSVACHIGEGALAAACSVKY